MVRKFYPTVFALLLLAITLHSCDQADNAQTVFSGTIQGIVIDTVTRAPISGARTFADEIHDTVLTDANGMYQFKNIELPRSDYIYYIKSTKQGYDTSSIRVKAKSDNTVIADTAYLRLLPQQ